MADGRVGHAELELGASALFLADESPESHVAAPRPGADATVSLVVEMPDVDGGGAPGHGGRRHGGARPGRQSLRAQRRGPRPLRSSLDHLGRARRHAPSARRPRWSSVMAARGHRLRVVVGARRRPGPGLLRLRAGVVLRPRQRRAGGPGGRRHPPPRAVGRSRAQHPVPLLPRRRRRRGRGTGARRGR